MAKLLIVDSNRKMWKRLRTRPESQKHRVERVTNVSQALKLLARDEFDLVLSDRGIAEANGYEFLREIRRTVPDALIILTSEDDGFWQASNTVPAGVCDYVPTLSSLEKIEQLIEQALENQRTRFRPHILR